MFAILQTGGKQLRVSIGDEIFIEKIITTEKVVKFDKVLMINDQIGKPYLKDAYVEATLVKQDRQKKIIVFKYKSKKNYHKKYGHRQPYSKVRIDKIVSDVNKKTEIKKLIKK